MFKRNGKPDEKLLNLLGEELLAPIILSQFFGDGSDKELLEDLNAYVTAKFLPQLLSGAPILNCPPRQKAEGDYLLGYVLNPIGSYPFLLLEEEMIKHILAVGSTGAGKTNTAFLLIEQFLRKGKPFLVFDWKRNYRDLLQLPEAEGAGILVFTVGRDVCPLHFNPLIPPKGTSPSVWLRKLIEIMCHAYFLGEGVTYLLTKAIDDVYKRFGVYEGSGKWPTFRNVMGFLENCPCKGRQTQWLASALRAVFALCSGEMDRTLNTGQYPIDELLRKNVVLELDALTDSDKVFFTETFLIWLHHYRMAEGKREQFKHATIIEEAHHILSYRLQRISGTETITDIILREIREFGESLVVIDQDPSLLSIPAVGNTYTTICFNLKERNDVNVMAASLMLDADEKAYLTKLEVGEAIVKLQGRHTDPFRIKVPRVPVVKGLITDEVLKQQMAKFYEELERIRQEKRVFEGIRQESADAKGIKTNKIEQKTSEDETDSIPNKERCSKTSRGKEGKAKARETEKSKEANTAKEAKRVTKSAEEATKPELSENEKKLLIDMLRNPISKVVQRYRRIGLNEYQGNKAQTKLIEKGLVSAVKLPSYEKSGYWGKAFELTEKGKGALRGLNIKVRLTKRTGSLQHRYTVELIAERLRQKGHQVQIECPIGQGKTTDIVVDRRIAVEVERRGDVVENIRKNLEAGLKIIVAVEDQKSRDKAREKLEQAGIDVEAKGVRVATVRELLERTDLWL